MNFFVVYCKDLRKFKKYIRVNDIKYQYILDIKKIASTEEIDIKRDKTYLKILILQKISTAMKKGKDIYYIPDFDNDFSIEKLLNLRKLLGDNNFNVLLFYNEFKHDTKTLDDVLSNLSKFTLSQIIRDY